MLFRSRVGIYDGSDVPFSGQRGGIHEKGLPPVFGDRHGRRLLVFLYNTKLICWRKSSDGEMGDSRDGKHRVVVILDRR